MQELNAKIKSLEMQLRARPHSPSNPPPHPIDSRDRAQSLSVSQTRLLSRPYDSPSSSSNIKNNNLYPIPLSVPNSPTPTTIGVPSLDNYVEENAMETKKRELEITKEFASREALTPRDAVSPRDSMIKKREKEREEY